MDNKNKIFKEIEQEANVYVARCLIITSFFGAIIWFLNIVDFFTVEDTVMNTAMPIGIAILASPTLVINKFKCQAAWVKYYVSICFVLGIAIMSSGMTYQVILAWACPIILSCHYYSPKVTKVTIVTTAVLLLLSLYLGMFVGSWDSNIMRSTDEIIEFSERWDYIKNIITVEKDDLLIRVFNLYYIPRLLIIFGMYVIGVTLTKRTHKLLDKQQANFLEKERIGTELSVATNIQKSMLPSTYPSSNKQSEYDLSAIMTPSKEVGGDFYDFFNIDKNHLALVIADVSGKGVPAALFMMATKIMIKNISTPEKTPAQILKEVNQQLCETNENEMFVTVWLGIYEISTGKIIATNAGHEYPVIKKNNGSFELLKDKHCFVIGGMDMVKYHDYEIQLDKGDTLFLYTDGIPEAINSDNEGYGAERLLAQLNKTSTKELDALLHSVKEDVDLFAGDVPQFDDITMLAIHRN